MKLDASKFTRNEKLLILVAFELSADSDFGTSHRISLILEGTKGLFDYTDAELDSYLSTLEDLLSQEVSDLDPKKILKFVREMSSIGDVSQETHEWKYVER